MDDNPYSPPKNIDAPQNTRGDQAQRSTSLMLWVTLACFLGMVLAMLIVLFIAVFL